MHKCHKDKTNERSKAAEYSLKGNKLKLSMQAIMLAALFTLSCSSGGDGDGGDSTSGISDLPTQLYIKDVIQDDYVCSESGECTGPIYGDTYEYNGDGDITITLRDNKGKGDKNTFYVGKIKNGKIIWELPEIPSDYFAGEEDIHFESGEFIVNISGKSYCPLRLQTLDGKEEGRILYSSITYKSTEDTVDEVNISKGWNVVYFGSEYYEQMSTDSKIIKGKLQWIAGCWIDD